LPTFSPKIIRRIPSRTSETSVKAYEYRDRLARAGVPIVFCSDGLISGNGDTFEVEGLKTVMCRANCGTRYLGAPNNSIRRVRHSRRPACAASATYRAARFEGQIADLLDGIRLTDADVRQVLAAMRVAAPAQPVAPGIDEAATQRQKLQEALAAGKLSLSAFSRAWRALERPKPFPVTPPDEIGLRRARKLLSDFGTLWRDPAVPDRLREEALLEIFARVEVDGPQVVAVYPQENENAWLLGFHATRKDVGVVGAKGVEPSLSRCPW
jgi:hypothetical protein